MTLTLKNPLTVSSSFTVQKHQRTIQIAGKDLSTGRKSNNDIISDLLGKKLESSAGMLRAVSKNIRYGTMVTDTASADLSAAKEVLLKLKQTIVASNTGSGETLEAVNAQYLQGEEELKNILSRSQVQGRKLFDHVGTENIEIRVGENINDTTRLELPDLREQTTNLKGVAPVGDNTKHGLVAGDAWGANNQTAAANQRAADNFVNNLITQVDTALNNMTAQKKHLQFTDDNIVKTAALHDEAAGHYLNTDYESTVEEFKKAIMSLRASLAVLAQGEMIGQLALKLIEQS